MRGVVASLILAVWGLAACREDALGPREPVPSKVSSSVASGAIELKFREGLRVRIIAGELRSAAGRSIDAPKRVFAAHGNPRVLPLFTLPVADLERLSREARDHSGRAGPDLGSWYRVTAPPGTDLGALVADLKALPEVEAAYPAPTPAPPPRAPQLVAANLLALVTADFSSRQTYFGPAPVGTEAEFARTQPGGRGQGIKIVDLEYDWYFEHEDLGLTSAIFLGGDRFMEFGNDHGTAVLGELVAKDNSFGVVGGVPDAVPRAVSPVSGGSYIPANGVAIATNNMKAGDVLLIEQQTAGPNGGCDANQTGCVPLEWIPAVYDAVLTATQAGKVVVAAAGNGAQNLDAAEFQGRFNRQLFNSGAIIVGAGNAQHAALAFSTYGSRVDLQGTGSGVTTSGYGDLSGSSTPTQADDYTGGFSGTSSASPIVAAAAAALEGNAKATGKPILSPDEVRSLLRRTGSPQTGALTRPIGPFPNLRAALGAPVVHNVWAVKSAMLQARSAFALTASGNLLYAIGGKSNGTTLASVEAYSPTTNTWTGKTALPSARYDGNGAAANGALLYLPGGANSAGTLTKTLNVYTVATNAWSAKAPLPILSGCGASVFINGLLYVLTGCDGTSGYKGLLHRYTPSSNSWSARATAPAAHGHPAVAGINGKLYVAGGRNAAGTATATLHVYDPVTNTWSTKASMPSPRFGAAGQVINGKLYVVGGTNTAGTATATLYVYDPATNVWSTKVSMPTARTRLGSGVINSLLYVVGGKVTTDLTKVERYTP